MSFILSLFGDWCMSRKRLLNKKRRLVKSRSKSISGDILSYFYDNKSIQARSFLKKHKLYSPISSFTGCGIKGRSFGAYNIAIDEIMRKINYCTMIVEMSSRRDLLFKNVIGLLNPPIPEGIVLDVYTEIGTQKFSKLISKNTPESLYLALESIYTNK